MKVILFNKYAMDLNTLFFITTVPKIGHSRSGHAQVAFTYVQRGITVIMDHKDL